VIAVLVANKAASSTPAWLTAIGGLLVFAATAVLARLAYRQMLVAARGTEVAEDALAASVRPLLISVPRHTARPIVPTAAERLALTMPGGVNLPTEVDVSEIFSRVDAEGARLNVPVRNVGAGVARILAANVTARGDSDAAPVVPSTSDSAVIAPGEHGYVTFEPDPRSEDNTLLTTLLAIEEAPLLVEVAYSDIAGRQETATSLILQRHEDRYRVVDVSPDHTRRLTAPSHEDRR
jgi:hypothetical protein